MADLDPPAELVSALDEDSREIGMLVDRSGRVLWSDVRARRHGVAAGRNLIELVVPGCEDKARELCRQGCVNTVTGWELPLVIAGKPATALFNARPCEAGAALVANLIAQDYADAIAESNRAVYEIVALNRELARQKLRLEESNTAIRALHNELGQHADRLCSAAEVKGRLVAGVSHEFRTPLHSILGLSRLLLTGSDGALNTEQQTQVRFIRDSAEELSRMINDLLDLSRLDSGSVVIRSEAFELRDLFAALRGTMAPLVADDPPVRLVFDPPPDVALETDHGKLSQIARNLISNALKFTARGVVQVTASVRGDELSIAVKDSGIGIAPDDQARVFEEFTQIDSPLQRATRGTGLGLPLARKLAENLGGRLELDSAVNVGSTFTVTIPMKHAEIARYRSAGIVEKQGDS
jgi:signal transduction histidine kinase